MIEVNHISYHYHGGGEVLKDVSFQLEPGKFLAILGNNGAGKSTGILALSVPGLTTRRRIPQSGRHWSRASDTGSSIPPKKRSS